LKATRFNSGEHPAHQLDQMMAAIDRLPFEDRNMAWNSAAYILGEHTEISFEGLGQAIENLRVIDNKYSDFFTSLLHQPLRYVFGEQLCIQCERNLGLECVPYAVLIAANIDFDPAKVSLADLDVLLHSEPRLNPDTRLAAISRIKLATPGDINELAERVHSELSLSIPPELRKKR